MKPKTFYLCDTLGAVVASRRTALGLTQAEFARRAGLHPMTISKIERGARTRLDVLTLRSIAHAFRDSGAPDATIGSLLAMAEEWVERLDTDPQLALHASRTSVLVAMQYASLNRKA